MFKAFGTCYQTTFHKCMNSVGGNPFLYTLANVEYCPLKAKQQKTFANLTVENGFMLLF